ncbi:MAG: PSP1 domain-containing protein [Planctomycetota bacterium]
MHEKDAKDEKPHATGPEPDAKPESTGPERDAESAAPAPPEEGAAPGESRESGEAPADGGDSGPAKSEAEPGEKPAGGSGAEKVEEGEQPSEKPETPKEPERGRYVVQARYGALPVTGTATVTDPSVPKSALCVIRTKRGTEVGMTLSAARPADGDVGETIGHVLRRATARDTERQQKIEDELEPDELNYCRQKIDERGLRMRLSGVEHIWGGERIVFYFTAERRVDFRALVRDLAWHFHTRIELRQIGARDEARLLADYEHCGQPLCCRTFLRSLEPVTMRMAKLQRTTLDPSKISGRCGRLMCCLRFEDAVYRELKKGLPQRGTRVAVGSDEGEVASTEILTQEVTVRLADGRMVKAPAGELRPPGQAADKAAGGEPSTDGGRPAPSAPAGRRQQAKPAEAPSGGGGSRRPRRRGRSQGAKKGPPATGGSPPSVRTKPARGRKGRRRGGRNQKPRPKGGREGGGSSGGRPSGEARKDARPEG